MSNAEKLEIQIGDKKISIEVGEVARQAAASAFVRMGESVVLVAAAHGTKPREDRDFFPLTVDYRERTYSAGRIPGGFFKREGKARDNEVLTSRIIDRSVRPLFPENLRLEVQVSAIAMSHDGLHDLDIFRCWARPCRWACRPPRGTAPSAPFGSAGWTSGSC
jgi:polyribonucleotide nucleotidyltransferase